MHKRTSSRLFIALCFLLWFPHFLYVPILTPYLTSLQLSYAFIGILLSSYGVMQLLCRIPIGILSDLCTKRKVFIQWGLLISFISCVLFTSSTNAYVLLLARVLAGLSAATWVVFTVYYLSFFAQQQTTKAMSIISFVIVSAQFIGMLLSGYLVEYISWQFPFILGMIASGIGVILSFLIEERVGATKKIITLRELLRVAKEPMLLKVSLLSILAHAIMFSTFFGFTSDYALSIGFSIVRLPLLVVIFMVPHALATLLAGNILIRIFGSWHTLLIAFLVTAICTLVIPIAHSEVLFYALHTILGFSLGVLFPVLLSMSITHIAPHKRASAMGAYQAFYALGIAGGPLIAGFLQEWLPLTSVFYTASFYSLCAVICIFYWKGSKE